MQKDYYLGLDMGTSSVGWAVTDEKYNLLRSKGKDLWGVRLFKEAETSEKRRTNRISRRRRQREKARIGLLKEIFEDEINKVDPSFYQRLDESKYHLDDKSKDSKYGLFSDRRFTDKEYFKKYPTIFHLRKELIESKEFHDVRLVYLAILNIFKHRGHFLNTNLDTEQSLSFRTLFEELSAKLSEKHDKTLDTSVEIEEVEEILSRKGTSRTKKIEEVAKLFDIKKSKEKQLFEIIKAIGGLKFNIDVLFDREYLDLEGNKISISFTDGDYDEKLENIINIIDEEESDILNLLKEIHDQAVLSNVMQGHKYLSEARVESYEKHEKDLKLLKKVIKKYSKDQYYMIFRSDSPGSYSAYVGSVNYKNKNRRNMKKRSAEDLYGTLKKVLKSCPDNDPDVKYILSEIQNEDFLPKQLTGANGVIPNQVHLSELKTILKNASRYFEFLNLEDEKGLSVSEKIISIFSFQIPYYVGPLNNYHADKGGNSWVVRKAEDKVLPWNFEELVDIEKTSEAFIENLIRRGTYIKDEKVLPKSSLIYEKYMVLNELNNLRIRGEKPSAEIKQDIYNKLFINGKKVTRKKLNDYLISNGIIGRDEISAVTGIDGDFTNSLSSFGKFHAILGDVIYEDEIKDIIEKIIAWGTIYGDDKKMYREKLNKELSDKLTTDQIKRISGFKFRDWGKLSKTFLRMLGTNKSTGEVLPLIQMLWEYNDNLMELLSDKYTYSETLIKEYSAITKSLSEMKYEDLNELYISSPVKRMVWQTLLIVKELEGIMQKPPKRIFVEMAREKGEKGKRTNSRKNRLIELYKNCQKDARDWVGELNDLEDANLRSKKLYLYYMQKGRCMYSGEAIKLSDLLNNNIYDIDHIYPRKLVKDDSLENNLVLVKKEINAHEKKDEYPLPNSIIEKQHSFWKSLLSKNMKDAFITREKYNRLISKNKLSDEQLANFINRQIVETRQGTKVITQILSQAFDDSNMVFVKASNISDFRHDFDLLKVRSVNDFHHANDAYLSIVVGNTYYVKFTKNPLNFIKNIRRSEEKSYHMSKIFNYNVKSGDEIAWIADDSSKVNSISIVKKMMNKKTPLITKMTYEGHGELFNATLYGAKKAKSDSYFPLKTSNLRLEDVSKYGGYTSVSTAHFFLVEHEVKGKIVRTIEALPLVDREKIGTDKEKMDKYCKEELGLINPDVRLSKIKINSLIKRDGFYLNITGKTLNRYIVSNFVPLFFQKKWVDLIKKIEKAINTEYLDKEITLEKNVLLYKELIKKHSEEIYSKRPNPIGDTLKNGSESFMELDILNQCKVIGQILQISQLSNLGADLTLIKGSKKSGKSLISKNISSTEEFILINQSITGLYKKEIDLLKI